MAQQVLPAQTDQNVTLDRRLLELDDVDRKIADLMETTKEIISNLEKDKQISKTKMDDIVKKFTRTLEEDIFRVVNEQLNYMEQLPEQLSSGSEHQISFRQNMCQLEISKRNLKLLHNELETLVPSKDIETTNSPSDLHLSEEENGSNFEDVVSIASEES